MSEDRSSNGQKSWLGKLTQAFAHEPKNRQELLELLREAHQNKLLDSEALAIVEGAIQVADLQVRDIMVPRSQMISIKATQTPREFLPAVIDSAHSRYPVIGESHDDVMGVLLAKDLLPLILKEIVGFSIREVADVLGLEEATAKSRVHRARLKLRAAVDKVIPRGSEPAPPPAYEERTCLDLLNAPEYSGLIKSAPPLLLTISIAPI